MPKPLSSQQNSTGIRSPWCTLYSAAFNAPRAVEWLSEASPNEQTAIASCRPRGADVDPLRALDREPDSHRSGQMRRDRRGLRDHRERVVAEHLVPPAGDRLVRGGDQAEEDVLKWGGVRDLLRPRAVEAARSVVEKRRVRWSERCRDHSIRLVARRPDRVDAWALLPQIARGQVEVPARRHRVEQREGHACRSAGCRRGPADRDRGRQPHRRGARPRARGSDARAPAPVSRSPPSRPLSPSRQQDGTDLTQTPRPGPAEARPSS